jgi:two-component system phosphate regulon sensor histidine kinase PhoR
MNDSKFKYTLYIISVVIVSTIAIQAYWNYKNYLSNKQQLISDVQMSLDKAVDDYYANLAQQTTLAFTFDSTAQKDVFKENGFLDQISKTIDDSKSQLEGLQKINVDSIEGITILRGFDADSLMNKKKDNRKGIKSINDSNNRLNFEMLTSKVMISITNDTLNLNTIDSLITRDLSQKQMDIDFSLDYKDSKNSSLLNKKQIIKYDKKEAITKNQLSAVSKSTFLPKGSTLHMYFKNITWLVFKRIMAGMVISFLIVLAVISCLFYLLKIIKHQKQLSEVKNDLISNITHEFKTPIATIGVALESIQSFNAIDDKAKTKTYLEMSSTQLAKLNTMVEKLLETATLDSENLELNKDRYNISEVIIAVIEKHKMQNDKSITCDIDDNVFANVDIFHFENAINNVIDNAFKYGGEHIQVALKGKSSQIEIEISDDGTSLSKANKERIFEKFYRVPKGNTHDVKGFGIGLYYTKKIIEKHNGTITIELNKDQTTFKIALPYA